MNEKKVVTRFPPSPTGYLHIGGARTALFNWLYARQNQGRFIFRIEDTDTKRSTEEASEAIIASMKWLGLDWDEGPYYQSQRYDLYNGMIDRLLDQGRAYYCQCSPALLEHKKALARERGLKPKYDRTCRDLGLGPVPGAVVRLKAPPVGETRFLDLIKGPMRFDNEELDDLILKRSDGSPTYHMAVVADDITLGVTHVIRGDDHLNNTPRQIQIYEALGEPLPHYGHVPLILGPDRTRLSKRHGAMAVLAYRDMGFMPHALLNALARLGWSYGDQEKFTLEEMIEKFSLSNVGKSAGIFNFEKLLDLNAWYLRESPTEALADLLVPFLADKGILVDDRPRLALAIETLKKRSKTLVEMAEKARIYFVKDFPYASEAAEKYLIPEALDHFLDLEGRLAGLSVFDQSHMEALFKDFLEEHKVPLKSVAQPLRVALTGTTVSPGLFELMEVLGRQETLARIRRAVGHISGGRHHGGGPGQSK